MTRQYPTDFRDEMVGRMLAGESVLMPCSDSVVPEQTLHRSKSQARVKAGIAEVITSTGPLNGDRSTRLAKLVDSQEMN